MVLDYADGGSLSDWMKNENNCKDWKSKIIILRDIISGLKEIHQNQMIHRDFHTGNILFNCNQICIADMGLCGKVDNVDKTKLFGVMPYIAPEVLRRKPYTKAADIYSFGMIMYFIATGKQPFADSEHDGLLSLDICRGIRPEINEWEAPKLYIDLMKRCWDLNPDNRPDATEIYDLFLSRDIKKLQRFSHIENYCSSETYSQPIYISQLIDISECIDDHAVINKGTLFSLKIKYGFLYFICIFIVYKLFFM
jgi:serine/threonine protein kinase